MNSDDLKARARAGAFRSREETRSVLSSLANLVDHLERSQEALDPAELAQAVEGFRRARLAAEAALRDAQERVDQVLDAVTTPSNAPARALPRSPAPPPRRAPEARGGAREASRIHVTMTLPYAFDVAG